MPGCQFYSRAIYLTKFSPGRSFDILPEQRAAAPRPRNSPSPASPAAGAPIIYFRKSTAVPSSVEIRDDNACASTGPPIINEFRLSRECAVIIVIPVGISVDAACATGPDGRCRIFRVKENYRRNRLLNSSC